MLHRIIAFGENLFIAVELIELPRVENQHPAPPRTVNFRTIKTARHHGGDKAVDLNRVDMVVLPFAVDGVETIVVGGGFKVALNVLSPTHFFPDRIQGHRYIVVLDGSQVDLLQGIEPFIRTGK